MQQLAFVASLARPRHILKALARPREMARKFRYHWHRVGPERFLEYVTGAGEARVRAAWTELRERHGGFLDRMRSALAEAHPDCVVENMTQELGILYALVRLVRPQTMVETGVADGCSSAHVLLAMRENGTGKLYSIDLPSERLPPGRGPGWIVEPELRDRWELRVGDAAGLLPGVLREAGALDVFLHDSLHTYEHMLWEYRQAWARLRPGGLLLSHDVGRHFAFLDFLDEHGFPWGGFRVHHVLGGARKSA